MSTVNYLQDFRLYDFFSDSNKITIFNNGTTHEFTPDSAEFKEIMKEFLYLINDAHEMPAYGVSLHEETTQALSNGLWLKFDFDEEREHNDMPFTSLLIYVNPQDQGFNLIREYQQRYEGRCFFLSLQQNTMQPLFEVIQKNIK
jgi:hypothetical protein